jgi:hypothetical protein
MYEPTQNEVKRKMIETRACNAAPKSHARLMREEKLRVRHNSLFGFLARFAFASLTLQMSAPPRRSHDCMPANLREVFRHL